MPFDRDTQVASGWGPSPSQKGETWGSGSPVRINIATCDAHVGQSNVTKQFSLFVDLQFLYATA